MPDLDTADEHVRAAERAGFADVRVADHTWSTRRSLRHLYKLSLAAWYVDRGLYRLGLRSKAQHGNVVASRRQYQLLKRGAWFYGIVFGTKP
jgi:hypothetical protein